MAEDVKISLDEVKKTLHSVIESLIDGQEGFQKIGEHLKDAKLKQLFLAESLKRAQFRGELESALHREGEHDPKETGSLAGSVLRGWGDLKAHMGGGDHTLLETAEQAEDRAKAAYKNALEKNLPIDIRQLLTSQYTHVQESHDTVKAARDATK